MDNFFKRPVGAAVLYLNDFHFGKHLSKLNRISLHDPEWVRSTAEAVYSSTNEGFKKDAPTMLEFAITNIYTNILNGEHK